MPRLVEDVLAAIDLPAIIRDSSGSMASETVRGARMTGITVDDAISRAIERHVFRRRGDDRRWTRAVIEHEELSLVPAEARPYQGNAAGIATRVAANTIDGLVVAVALLGAYAGYLGAAPRPRPRGFQAPDHSLLLVSWRSTAAWSST